MIVLGLTGGIASGKSTVAARLRSLGAHVIDADRVGHLVLEPAGPAYQPVVDSWGFRVLNEDGTVNRKALGAIVFADRADLARLNAISHPAMRSLMAAEIQRSRAAGRTDPVVLDAAILYEAGWDDLCDSVWAVIAPEDEVIARIQARNGLNEAQARARLAAQLDPAEKARRADAVLDNGGSLADLEAQVDERWNALMRQPVRGAR